MDGSIARPRPLIALLIRLLAVVALATLSMLVKLGSENGVHLLEMIFWRQAITLVLIGVILAAAGKFADLKTKRIGAHGLRAFYGITGMCFVYGAVVILPLAEATMISFTTPFFAVMLAVILFREKVGIYRWSAVVMGFAGVLIVIQPFAGGGFAIDPFGLAVGLGAAFLVALISFQIQDLNKTESPWSIVFWFTALTTPVAALALPFVLTMHEAGTWTIIIAMAVTGAIAQILLTSSLRFGSAAVIIVMDYTALLWATLYGWKVFEQLPSTTIWLGAPLIIGAGILITYRERMLAKKQSENPTL